MVSSPSRPTLTVALGVLLLASPLYVDALHLDEPNRYRYESAEVTPGPEGLEVGDRSVLTLNRTPTDEAMRYVASPLSRASDPVRTAVRSCGVEIRRELDGANELREDDGEYYVVYEVASRGYGGAAYRRKVRTGRLLETGFAVLGTGVGLLAVLRGQRRRVERERRR